MDETALRKFKDKDDFPSKDDIVRTHPHTIRSVKLEKAGGGYGLYLKMEKGSPLHIISDVEKGGAADRAGLLDDEIVIAVEGSSVMADTHEECVQKIKDAGDAVGLLVCGRKSADFLHKLKVAIDLDLHKEWPSSDEFAVPKFERPPKTKEEPTEVVKKVATVAKVIEKADDIEMKPRLCRIEKREGGFGFFLKDENGHYLINVEDQGPAYHAGVLEYDRIIEINGDNAEKLTHNDVVTKIRQSGDTVTFLVVNKEEDKYFQERGILISSVLLTAAINEESELSDDHKPRLCKLTRTTKGYGFHLMGESNQQGQFVKEIVSGGAADSAGLRNGDRIVEVNDVNVMTKSHDEIVKKITENSDGVTFLVIDKEGEAYYKRKGVAIVAGLVAAKAIDELVEEKQDEKADAENDSIGHGSAASSIIETEATVHQEAAKEVKDDENKVGEAIAAVVAVKAVEEVIEDIQERKEEQEESKEEKIENAVEEIAQQISEVSEEERATEEEEEIGLAAKAAVAVVAASAVEEIVDNHVEEEIREKVLEEKVEEAIESLSDTEKSSEGVAETIEDVVEEIADEVREAREEQDKVAAEKVAAGIVAAAVVQKVLEREDEESKRESDDSRSSSPHIAAAEEETLKDAVEEIVEENEALEKAIENHIEEEEQDEIKKQATIAAALVQSEMMNKINGEGSEKSDGEKSDGEGEVNLEPEFVAPAVVVAAAAVRAASPEPVQEITPREIIENHVEESKKIEAEIKIEGESKSVEAVITIEKKPQPAAVLIKEAVSEPEPAPPKSLAAAIIEQTEQPKLRPTPEPQKVPFVWGQHKLRPVNRQPAKPAAEIADVVEKQNESSDAAPKSSVAAMREAIERRNRANQRDALANEIKDELAQLSKQNGAASKRIEMFGGSARKSNSNAPPKTKKQMSWTGEGMTIKIVET